MPPQIQGAAVVRARLADRDKRASQREAVFRLIIPLLTAFPKARLTARISAENTSGFLPAMASLAFLIKVLSLDLDSMFRDLRFKL
jgi:hypothetical protein